MADDFLGLGQHLFFFSLFISLFISLFQETHKPRMRYQSFLVLDSPSYNMLSEMSRCYRVRITANNRISDVVAALD
jgi:hypothetical protein